MSNLLSWDQVLDALANYQVTVRPGKDQILVKDAGSLPVQVRLTMRYWKTHQPWLREALMQYVCAVASDQIRDLDEYMDPEYRAVMPDRERVAE